MCIVSVLRNVSVILFGLFTAISVDAKIGDYAFPDDFQFGIATASYQVEGAWDEDGKTPSIWDTLLHNNPNFTLDHSNGDMACDSYHLWQRDIEMVRDLGVDLYRFSISWPRLLPEGTSNRVNPAAVTYYNNIIDALLAHGITPMITLYHWDLPSIFQDLGGWTNPVIADYFEDYARVVFKLFGDRVRNWITINEPHQSCVQGYGLDTFAPAINAHGIGVYLCSHYQLLSHARVYHLYNKEFRPIQNGTIGITLDSFWAEPKNRTSELDKEAVEIYLQMHFGLYAHPIFTKAGNYPKVVRSRIDQLSVQQGFIRSRLPMFTPKEVAYVRGTSDFFGLNHYTTYQISFAADLDQYPLPSMDRDTGVILEQDPAWPKTGAEWLTIYPPGFRRLINWIATEYGRRTPIVVTENGVSQAAGDPRPTHDLQRVDYYNAYLEQLLRAMHEDGCNVRAYIAWTLMDDFEWFAGYTHKFGLYHVDFESPERTRTPKLSAFNYKEIVRSRVINTKFIDRTLY